MKLALDHLRTHRDTARRLEAEVAEAMAAVNEKLRESGVYEKQAKVGGWHLAQIMCVRGGGAA